MSAITDLLLQQVKSATGNVEIPSGVKNQVLGGLSDSIMGSLTQTVVKPGGVDLVKGLLTGKDDAASSPVTALAGKLFANNVISQLGLGKSTGNALTALIPGIIGKLSGILKDRDGDGDVDINDIILTLKGDSAKPASSSKGSLLGAATSILGSILKK